MKDSTDWARGCRAHVDELCKQETWIVYLGQIAAALNRYEFGAKYQECLCQKWREPYDVYDAFCIAFTDAKIKSGAIAVFQIPINDFPCSDKNIDGMNEKLSKLASPFYAEFWGGTQDEDGKVVVDRPVNAIIYSADGQERGFCIVPDTSVIKLNGSVVRGAGYYPLEVGYMGAHKLYMYLCGARFPGLARWPYGQDRITVFSLCLCGANSVRFDEFKHKVYGNFLTLPNPYEGWWIENEAENE